MFYTKKKKLVTMNRCRSFAPPRVIQEYCSSCHQATAMVVDEGHIANFTTGDIGGKGRNIQNRESCVVPFQVSFLRVSETNLWLRGTQGVG